MNCRSYKLRRPGKLGVFNKLWVDSVEEIRKTKGSSSEMLNVRRKTKILYASFYEYPMSLWFSSDSFCQDSIFRIPNRFNCSRKSVSQLLKCSNADHPQ